jgi:hypothetical protein
LTGPQIGKIAVPDLVSVFRQRDAGGFAVAFFVEQAQFDALGVLGENRDIDPLAVPDCAARMRTAGPHARAEFRRRTDHGTRAARERGIGTCLAE